jgi:hypothetical protein
MGEKMPARERGSSGEVKEEAMMVPAWGRCCCAAESFLPQN